MRTKISVSLGGLPCLADGNKVRQVFTNLLSSSPFSPLQDYLACSSPMNVSHMSPMLQKSPLCLIWLQRVEKARHATLFSFQPSPARLIKPGFTKNWEFWRRGSSWCVSERKAAGRILSASSHWFSRVCVNQTEPLLAQKLPQSSGLCPLLRVPVLTLKFCSTLFNSKYEVGY